MPITHHRRRFARAAAGYSGGVLLDGPAAYWRLGEASGDALDSSGNSRAATWTGTPFRGITGAIAGDTDKAVMLDGSAWANAGNPAALQLATGTMEAWVKTTAPPDMSIISKQSAYGIYLLTDGRPMVSSWAHGWVAGQMNFKDGQWHHVAATFGGGTMELYADGALAASGPFGVVSQASALLIGNDIWSTGSQPYSGAIDEAAVYPVKLSAARIKAHYDAGR